jgi:hypothetical protein
VGCIYTERTETACLQTRTVWRSLNRGVSLCVCVCLPVSVAWLIKHCTDLCYSNEYDPSYKCSLVMNFNSSLYVSNSKLWQMKWAFCDQCPPFTFGHSDKWWRNLERRACHRSSSMFCTETRWILAVASVFLAEFNYCGMHANDEFSEVFTASVRISLDSSFHGHSHSSFNFSIWCTDIRYPLK